MIFKIKMRKVKNVLFTEGTSSNICVRGHARVSLRMCHNFLEEYKKTGFKVKLAKN